MRLRSQKTSDATTTMPNQKHKRRRYSDGCPSPTPPQQPHPHFLANQWLLSLLQQGCCSTYDMARLAQTCRTLRRHAGAFVHGARCWVLPTRTSVVKKEYIRAGTVDWECRRI